MSTTEVFLAAMILILAVPYLAWRLSGAATWLPLVVVQIVTGVLLGPGVLGRVFPEPFHFVFRPEVVQPLNGIAWWGVMAFVAIAGMELDLRGAWTHRRESVVTAGLALGTPLFFGALAASVLAGFAGWAGVRAQPWQFTLGVGMSCAVTALPILVLFMDELGILRQPLGQRILRYASLDDIAIWAVLALILTDWQRVGRQALFLAAFALCARGLRALVPRLPARDRWAVAVIWLAACGLGADWSGLHFMVGAFLSGVVMEAAWFERDELDALRRHVLLLMMPVFFLSTGLRTSFDVGGPVVFAVALALLVPAVAGKLLGLAIAGRLLKWRPGEAALVGWLLQTKALIMIIFANVLLDKQLITADTFTALLLMAVASTVLTMPVVAPRLARLRELVPRSA